MTRLRVGLALLAACGCTLIIDSQINGVKVPDAGGSGDSGGPPDSGPGGTDSGGGGTDSGPGGDSGDRCARYSGTSSVPWRMQKTSSRA